MAGKGTSESAPEEPKTETTLTTRIRINIPGSRPIPPVVMRTPVGEETVTEGDESSAQASEQPAVERAKKSDRSSGRGSGAEGGAVGSGATAAAAGSGAAGGTDKSSSGTSDWFAPRKPSASSGQSGARPKPSGPSGATAPTGGPAPAAGGAGASGAGRPSIPYLNESPSAARPAARGESPFPGEPAFPGPGGGEPLFPEVAPGAGEPPFPGAGPSAAGPSLPFGGGVGGPVSGGVTGSTGVESGPPPGGLPFTAFSSPDSGAATPPGIPEVPNGPTTGPVTGGMYLPSSDGAEARTGYRSAGGAESDDSVDHVSGATLVSGIPAVTPPPGPGTAPQSSAGAAKPAGKSTGKPARKGRSKVALAGVGLLAVVGIAYAAGLLMDHADVPNGTTVLGVDIGGKTKDEATKALDAAVGSRGAAPMKVRVGNQDKELKPQLAGLSIDTQETIREVAHRDYNPISVIGSLFGGAHTVKPAITVDQEKLRSQLQSLSSGAGNTSGGSDGMVKFVDGKPVGVPGTPYQAVDADGSVQKITAAYTERAETGKDESVDLAVTTHQPQVTQDAINQAIKNIGDPAMSGKITVTAGTKSVLFSPQKSLSRILTIVPAPNGKLTLHIDLAVLKELYGNAFDGVLLERGIGTKTPVTPQDVASAMLPALGKTAPEKTASIQNVAN